MNERELRQRVLSRFMADLMAGAGVTQIDVENPPQDAPTDATWFRVDCDWRLADDRTPAYAIDLQTGEIVYAVWVPQSTNEQDTDSSSAG